MSAAAARAESLALWFSQFINFFKWTQYENQTRDTPSEHTDPHQSLQKAHTAQQHSASLKGIQTLRIVFTGPTVVHWQTCTVSTEGWVVFLPAATFSLHFI